MQHFDQFIIHYGYFAIFALLMLGIVGPLIPDETIMVFAGALIHDGRLHPIPAFIAAYAGSLCGITLSYLLGRTGVTWVLRRFDPRGEHIGRVRDWFERYGKWTLFFGYFIVGIRHFTALVAGTSRVDWREFAAYAYPGGLLWVIAFLSLGYFLGDQWTRIAHQVDRGLLIGAIVIAAGIGIFLKLRHKRRNSSVNL